MSDPVDTDALRRDARVLSPGFPGVEKQLIAAADEVERLRAWIKERERLQTIASPGLVLDALIVLPRISSAGLRKIADEAQRVIDGRMEDGVFE